MYCFLYTPAEWTIFKLSTPEGIELGNKVLLLSLNKPNHSAEQCVTYDGDGWTREQVYPQNRRLI